MSEENKPHLVLHWTFDVPNQKLTTKIGDDLEYEMLQGGLGGFNKTYKGVKTYVTYPHWLAFERDWISQHYGHLVGYFQPDPNRVVMHPKENRPDSCPNGVGPDGRYLDHTQRMQIVMEGGDMSTVYWKSPKDPLFLTPDCGKTIYKRVPTRDIEYPEAKEDPDAWWVEWPQPCGRQPRSKGPRISSYQELLDAGCPQDIVDKCMAGEWAAPEHPELQQYYIYPTKEIDYKQ